jgi:hypothetical protein
MSQRRPLPKIAEPPPLKASQTVSSVDQATSVYQSAYAPTVPLAASEPSCKTCRWWRPIGFNIPGSNKTQGYCHGTAPTQAGIVQWPITAFDDDCPAYTKRDK